jgi:hypothetical protein
MNSKWLNINEEIAYRKLISCTNITELKILRKMECKWGKQQKKTLQRVDEDNAE